MKEVLGTAAASAAPGSVFSGLAGSAAGAGGGKWELHLLGGASAYHKATYELVRGYRECTAVCVDAETYGEADMWPSRAGFVYTRMYSNSLGIHRIPWSGGKGWRPERGGEAGNGGA